MTTTVTWESDNGTTWPLDGSAGVTLVDNAVGLFTIPTDLFVEARIGHDGSVLTGSRRSSRSVVLSLMVEQDSQTLTLWASLFSAFAAGGTLHYDGPNGERELRQCVLEAPGDGRLGYDLGSIETDVIAVSLLALDPWWYGAWETVTGTFDPSTEFNENIAFNAHVPFNGGSSIPMIVTGDRATYPMFLVRGAFTSLTVGVGDNAWSLAEPLASGQWLALETYPSRRGPHLGAAGMVVGVTDSAVDWTLLTPESRLGEIEPGDGNIVYQASGTDGSSAWQVHWESRWLTP